MQTIDLLTLIPRCHEAAKAKGFWDALPNAGQMLMLAIGELGEAQEAHRKGRFHHCNPSLMERMAQFMEFPEDAARELFQDHIKDAVQDELADTYIRLCDFAGGYKLDLQLILAKKCDPEGWAIGTDNFGDALLTCVSAIIDMHKVRLRTGFAQGCMEGPLSDALTWIEVLARQNDIDLATHIDLKLRYNATRARLHGKAY